MDEMGKMISFLHLEGHPLAEILPRLAMQKTFPPRTMLLGPEEQCQQVHFLISGLLRGYLLDIHGDELTECFPFRYGDIRLTSFNSMQGRLDGFVETLEETRFFVFDFAELTPYFLQYPELTSILIRKINEVYIEQTQHKRILFHTTAMERYKWFLESYPGLIDRVPHKYVASFLNITPVTLSRLRREERESSGSAG